MTEFDGRPIEPGSAAANENENENEADSAY